MRVDNCARCLTVGVVSGGMLLLIGCGGPQKVPPPAPPSGSNTTLAPGAPTALPKLSATSGQATVAMQPASFPADYPFATFATRGVRDWKATPSSDGSTLTCSFRSTSGAEAHYGGIATPLPGTRGFRLTVTFPKGAAAVKSVFVTALNAKGDDSSRWGYGVRAGGARLADNKAYVWEFLPGATPTKQFWTIPAPSPSRTVVHFFVDVDPDEQVSFRIDKIENQG
jgi:hypothetical protein